MEQFFSEHYMIIGLIAGLFITVFGLIWTVLERKLVVSRKHVTGVSGFTSTVLGALICSGAVYQATNKIRLFIVTLAIIIAIYVLTCLIVTKEEYSPEERYTKE